MKWDDFTFMLFTWLLVLVIIGFVLGVRVAGGSDDYRITYYGEEFRGGPLFCTGEAYNPDDPTVAASGSKGFPCATTLRVCTSTCIIVVVQDRCGGCSDQHLDVSQAAWETLGKEDYAQVEVLPSKLPDTGCGCYGD